MARYPRVFGSAAAKAQSRAASVAMGGASITISGSLATAIIGQPYDASLIVTPPGSPVTLDAATITALAARSINHDGFGRFTSAGVIA